MDTGELARGCLLSTAVAQREGGAQDGLTPRETTQMDGKEDNGVTGIAGELYSGQAGAFCMELGRGGHSSALLIVTIKLRPP